MRTPPSLVLASMRVARLPSSMVTRIITPDFRSFSLHSLPSQLILAVAATSCECSLPPVLSVIVILLSLTLTSLPSCVFLSLLTPSLSLPP